MSEDDIPIPRPLMYATILASGDAFIQELTKYRSKSADRKKHAAVKSLVDMLEAGMIDEEAALQALRNVKG